MDSIVTRIFRYFFLIGLFFIATQREVGAQFISAKVGIDGLTCSMCSNSVEKLIRQLDFVSDVKMDLNNTTAEITFKAGKKVSIQELSKKVFDSGFSVRSIEASFHFQQTQAKEGVYFMYDGDEYVFVKAPEVMLNETKVVTFVGKKFMSPKEFSHWKSAVGKYKGTTSGKSLLYHIAL